MNAAHRLLVPCVLVAALSACQSTEQVLDKYQDQAIATALQRARFDLDCAAATGTVLSRKMVEPLSVRFGIERQEYTVGVEGCGKRTSVAVLCSESEGCFSAEGAR